MEETERNPFAKKDGNPKHNKVLEWAQWEEEHQTYLKSIWRLPIEERRERAIIRQSVQRRWDVEAGIFYDDEEHERRLLETMKLYKAI